MIISENLIHLESNKFLDKKHRDDKKELYIGKRKVQRKVPHGTGNVKVDFCMRLYF